MPPTRHLRPVRIAVAYVAFASLWILTSDYLVNALLHDVTLHSYKGLFFVLATGALLYWLVAREDAAMRQSQTRLLESHRQFQFLVESAPDAIYILTGGCFRYLNPAALRLLGALDARQLLGRSVLDFIMPEYRELIAERIDMVEKQKIAAPLRERTMLRLDGTTVDAEASAVPVVFEGQASAVVFVRDISGRRLAEQHEEQLKEQIRQAQKMESLGRLAGGIAHDFNNLLTVINGYADMLLEELPQDHAHKHCSQEIRDAGERAAALTRQLLTFSRKDVGERRLIDVNAVIRDAERMLARLVGEHIQIAATLDPAVGYVRADPAWIHQVLLNLVINSRDAMPNGGRIEVRTFDAEVGESQCRANSEASPGRHVRISVADSGAGMTPEVLARAFEPFFTTKPSWQGTGLGLSTVYGIVHNCHGWITADSHPGAGTTVNLWFPVCGSDKAAPDPVLERTNLRGNETILLVEDDPVVRQATAAMLRHYGYAVVPAASGSEALQLAAEYTSHIDVVLSDVVMPEMTGPEVIDRLRRLRPGVKALLMSGYRPDDLVDVAASIPFISKPFTAASLARRIRGVLDLS